MKLYASKEYQFLSHMYSRTIVIVIVAGKIVRFFYHTVVFHFYFDGILVLKFLRVVFFGHERGFSS